MACCCNSKSQKSSAACLGRCGLAKHRCLIYEEIRQGPIPKDMGWLYTARDGPEHQLRCGWRPGHIDCEALRRMEEICFGSCGAEKPSCPDYPCVKPSLGSSCPVPCYRKPPSCFSKPPCYSKPPCFSKPKSCRPCCQKPSCTSKKSSKGRKKPSSTIVQTCLNNLIAPTGKNPALPLIRVVRHNGQYTVCTKPSDISNAPSGPYPLKYVLNTDGNDFDPEKPVKFSVEAKYNNYQFDVTCSQTSFVLDFSPPGPRCEPGCPDGCDTED